MNTSFRPNNMDAVMNVERLNEFNLLKEGLR